ncbi:hypothetical protein [Phytomonospora endophytica]|uniref:Uncharacterized protein n=1 Tax=Phytomonospora endophytica TaxID=714109 RepID=A0A841FRT9_9ACTN|nr:hypothetical protein [Phytomonospora endophytica]MBB6037523.1 hypothetical protein [Phytomonospora endophytica]GIG70775.1 hypothetical protein Pen01_70700 [Phytomonospora endophytica]
MPSDTPAEHQRHPTAVVWTIVMAIPPLLILPVLFLVLLGGALCEGADGCGGGHLSLAMSVAIAGPLLGAAVGITGAWLEWRMWPQIGLGLQIGGLVTACVAVVP